MKGMLRGGVGRVVGAGDVGPLLDGRLLRRLLQCGSGGRMRGWREGWLLLGVDGGGGGDEGEGWCW